MHFLVYWAFINITSKFAILLRQMVQNGYAKCLRRTLSGIEEKTISEDENSLSKVLIRWHWAPLLFKVLLAVFETTLFIVLTMIADLSFCNVYCHYLKRYDPFNAEATVARDHMHPTFAPVRVSFPNFHLVSIDRISQFCFCLFLTLYQLQCMIPVVFKLQSFASKKLNNAYEFGKSIPVVDKTVDESWLKSMPNQKFANSKGTWYVHLMFEPCLFFHQIQ